MTSESRNAFCTTNRSYNPDQISYGPQAETRCLVWRACSMENSLEKLEPGSTVNFHQRMFIESGSQLIVCDSICGSALGTCVTFTTVAQVWLRAGTRGVDCEANK